MFDLGGENPALVLAQLSANIALPRVLREAAHIRLGHFVGEQARSLTEIAQHYDFDEQVLGQFLDVLIANDILLEEDGLYFPTKLSDELDLVNQLFVGMEGWHCWSRLSESLRTGKPVFESAHGEDFFSYLARHPEKNDNWKRWNSITAREWFADLPKELQLTGKESICDIGGGEGVLLDRILETHPDCRCTLLERPEVQPDAAAGFDWVAGDMFGEIPEGQDVYILARVFCNWDDDSMLRVLVNIASAMHEGSRLVIVDGVLPGRGDPDRAIFAANNLSLFLTFGGRLRELEEFQALLSDAKLNLREVRSLATESGFSWSILFADHC